MVGPRPRPRGGAAPGEPALDFADPLGQGMSCRTAPGGGGSAEAAGRPTGRRAVTELLAFAVLLALAAFLLTVAAGGAPEKPLLYWPLVFVTACTAVVALAIV